MSETMVVARGFTKRYGAKAAVDGIGFEVGKGEIFALLGPNGAGKTTALECLEGIRRADSGELRICGLDPVKDSRKLMMKTGIQLQTQGLPGSMTVKEAVVFFAHYRGLKPDFGSAERLGLGDELSTQFRALSVGRQRRLCLALALGHDPELVFLDEPTAGLDVESRDELHALMAELRDRGKTIVLASHDMAEVEKLADRAIVLIAGRVAAQGSPRELTAGGAGRTLIVSTTAKGRLAGERPALPGCEALPREGEYARYLARDPGKALKAMLEWLEAAGDEVVDLRVERPSLEERFLELVGRKP